MEEIGSLEKSTGKNAADLVGSFKKIKVPHLPVNALI
jgi:hypothetical protein